MNNIDAIVLGADIWGFTVVQRPAEIGLKVLNSGGLKMLRRWCENNEEFETVMHIV